MRASLLLGSIICIALVALGMSIPIPARYGGYKKGSPSAPVVIEMWGDFQCMDCRIAWPIVRQVMAHYGDEKLFFILHPFPLTMHRQAWDAAQTAAIVSQQVSNPSHLFDFFDFLWKNQPSFSQATFYGKTQADLYALMSGYAAQWGVSNSTFYSKMGSDAIFNLAYNGVQMGGDRHVYMTPTFYINGIQSTFDEKTTFSEWVTLIDSLINGH